MTRAEANHLLDYVRAGGDVSDTEVLFALWVTGEFEVSPYRETHKRENPFSLLELDSQ